MKKRILKTQNLISLGVSSFLLILLIFLILKPENLDPCDCVDLMKNGPAAPVNSLKGGEVTQFKEQKNLTEEQFQKYLDCEKEFQSYGRVTSLCNEGKNNKEKKRIE